MNKVWRIVSAVALICLVVGIMGIGVGFFTGSSPTVIQTHGSLTEYIERLQINWGYLQEDIGAFLARLSLYI